MDKLKRDQGGLRRSRSVRASLRMIGNRLRSQKEDDDDVDNFRRNSVVFSTQVWNKDYEVAYTGLNGNYKPKTPIMTKRKHETVKQRRKSGDIEIHLKPQTKPDKVEKAKFSDFFNKKQKSASAKELLVHEEVKDKVGALLKINSPEKDKKKLKDIPKSESAKCMTELIIQRRPRRTSESDMLCPGSSPKGLINPAFVYSTPPKDRKQPSSPSYLSTYNYFLLPNYAASFYETS